MGKRGPMVVASNKSELWPTKIPSVLGPLHGDPRLEKIPSLSGTRKRKANGGEKFLVVEWLGEECRSSGI
jgi:hypothetical protein